MFQNRFLSITIFKGADKNKKILSIGSNKIYQKRNFSVKSLDNGKFGENLIIPQATENDTGTYECHLAVQNAKTAIFGVSVGSNPKSGPESAASSTVVISTFLYFLCFSFICAMFYRSNSLMTRA